MSQITLTRQRRLDVWAILVRLTVMAMGSRRSRPAAHRGSDPERILEARARREEARQRVDRLLWY